MRASDVPDHRAIIITTPEQLMDGLGLKGDLLHVEVDHVRRRVSLVVAHEDLGPVEPYCEAPVVPAASLSVRTPHSEAPPQYRIRVTIDGEQVGEAIEAADPFHRTTVVIDPGDVDGFRADDPDAKPIEVVVHVDGTPAALRHVFAPIDLRPNDRAQVEGPPAGTSCHVGPTGPVGDTGPGGCGIGAQGPQAEGTSDGD